MSSVYGRICVGCGHDEVMVAFLPVFEDEGRQKRDADGCGLIECSGCGRVQSDYEEPSSQDGVNESEAASDDARGGPWQLLHVYEGPRSIWLAAIGAEWRLYVYTPNTGKFHRNDALGQDYFWDQELSYDEVDIETARLLMSRGVGHLDAVRNDRQLRRYMDDECAVEVGDVDYRLAID